MPTWHEPGVNPQRRDLLALTVTVPLALVGTLLVATPVASLVVAPAPPQPAPVASPVQQGYHSSRHIDTYYRSLRY